MTQQSQNAAGHARLVTAINAVDAKAVAAQAAIAALPANVVIDDAVTAANKVWSSTKTQAQITAAVTALLNGAGVADDTLKELADKILALAQADNGLLSFAAQQVLTAPQLVQAWANLELGDPAHNYVTAIAAALNPGL